MKSIHKDLLRKILKNKIRFLYLMIITILGSSTYIALNILPRSMNKTISNIYEKYNVYDIKIFNNLGFNNKEKEILNNINGIESIEYVYNKEYLLKSEKVINLFSLSKNILKLNIIEGKEPKNNNELIIEYRLKNIYPINSNIELQDKKYIVTGYFENPVHRLLDNHEIAYKGLNKTDILAYTIQSNFQENDLKNIYIKLEKDKNLIQMKNLLEQKLYSYDKEKEFKSEKLKFLLKEETKLINGIKEIETGINKIQNEKLELNKINKDILKKENLISSTLNNINKNEKVIEQENIKIQNSIIDIDAGLKKLQDGLTDINSGILLIEESLNKIDSGLKEIEIKEIELNNNLYKLRKIKSSIFFSENKKNKYIKEINDALNTIIKEKEKLFNNKKELNSKLSELNIQKNQINNNISDLTRKKEEVFIGNVNIKKNKEVLAYNKNKFLNDYDENILKIKNSKKDIKNAYYILNNKEKDLIIKKNNIRYTDSIQKIKNLKEEISSLKNIYIVSTYMDNASYISYVEGIESLNIISKIFPIIFYFIVIFITITTMTRLIEEDRSSIGTMRFLGYSDIDILIKYLIYALIPTILGLFIGNILGFIYLPRFIYTAYNSGSISTFNNLEIIFSPKLYIISFIASIISSFLSVYISIKASLNVNVASLLKMKSPNKSKKIFLEKFNFLWNKLKFTTKITIRNIFRYKIKLAINIIGIAGCSSLIFLAFSIKDSFNNISYQQFDYLRPYKAEINIKNNYNKIEIDNLLKNNNYIYAQKIYAKILNNYEEKYVDIYVFNDNISSFIKIIDSKNNNINLEDKGIYISQRALELSNKSIGENILIKDYYMKVYNFNIFKSFQNYSGNYIYMTKKYYESLGYKYKENIILVKDKINNYDKFFKNPDILYIYETNTQKLIYDKISNSLNYIVLFIMIFSAILSFVVTYSLLDININERKKEISTIKVLGFRKIEIFKYIYSETILLTIIASLLGIILGIILHKSVIFSMRNTNVIFIETISLKTYILTLILTYVFSFISIVISFRKINVINMVESLKIDD